MRNRNREGTDSVLPGNVLHVLGVKPLNLFVKRLKYCMIFLTPVLMASMCKQNPLHSPNTPTVKLSAAVSDTAETIHLGDTLRFTLVVPDTLTALSKIDGTSSKLPVTSVQRCSYGFTFYNIDTITNYATRITDAAHIFVTKGIIDPYLYSVSTTTANKPFASILNLIPPARGLYYIQTDKQENLMKVNNSYLGLRMNFSVSNKHWAMYASYFINPNTLIATISMLNEAGYGFYCFKVI